VGVRLDSGDMVAQSRVMRALFDQAGFPELKIFSSSGFDEFKIEAALTGGAAIDAFGVGTKMGVSADRPFLELVYKLVCLDGRPIRKLSSGKVTLAGAKQVYRRRNEAGGFEGDHLACRDEVLPDAQPLLMPVMRAGRRRRPRQDLSALRRYLDEQRKALPQEFKPLAGAANYPVTITPRLQALQNST
jgi:nicotinate phosphoribosyltransferase